MVRFIWFFQVLIPIILVKGVSALPEPKFKVAIKTLDRGLPTSEEALEGLKGLGSKTLKRMRKEAVDCPVREKTISFIECFACKNFIHRVKGVVGCRGEALT